MLLGLGGGFGSPRVGSARGVQDVGVAYSGTLWADTTDHYTPALPFKPSLSQANVSAVSVTTCGVSASIGVISCGQIGSGIVTIAEGEDSAEVRAVALAFAGSSVTSTFWVYAVTVGTASMPPTVDRTLYACGWHFAVDPPNPPIPSFHGVTEISADWAISMTGAYRRGTITQSLGPGQSGLRHPCQRTGEGKWYADENTTVSGTCGGSSVSASYGVGVETDVSTALGLTPYIGYTTTKNQNTAYARVTANVGTGADAVGVPWSQWTFYKDTGNSSTWHWHGSTYQPGYTAPPSDADTYWKTVPSGNSITVYRCARAAYNDVMSWSDFGIPAGRRVIPRLWRQNKAKDNGVDSYYPYTEYDDTAGHPFDIGLYKHYKIGGIQQTDAEVSVAPAFDGEGYTYLEFLTGYGPAVPDDVWRVFNNVWGGFSCYLRKDWLVQNGEDVVFTLPETTKDVPRVEDEVEYPLQNIKVPCTFHDLVTPLTDDPWKTDWCEWTRTELNLDKPPGTDGVRPSQWTGSAVSGETWTLPTAGASVERVLATRRYNRLNRINSHLWVAGGTTRQEVTYNWLIQTRANLPFITTGDDPKWWNPLSTPWPGDDPGILIEDVTDWRAFSCVQLSFDGAVADVDVSMELTYYTVTAYAPWFTSAYWNFGTEEGLAMALLSEAHTKTVTGKLYASTGKCKFDLAPDADAAEEYPLELVESVKFTFPAGVAQTLTFKGFATVPYKDGVDVSTERMRIACKHSTDYFGAETSVDGMQNYKPTYGYTLDTERREVGWKAVQDMQHDPDYEGPADDMRYIKTLATWVGEQLWSEVLLQPTWHQDNINFATVDGESISLGTPIWGDYDEDGFCFHVGVDKEVTFPGNNVVYCDYILQGGARGISKKNGTRHTERTNAITLYYSDDAGVTKTAVRTGSTGECGEYNIGTGKEKDPRTYYLKTNQWFNLNKFVNVEEVWKAISISGGGRPLFLHMDRWGNMYTLYTDGTQVKAKITRKGTTQVQKTLTIGDAGDDILKVYMQEAKDVLYAGAELVSGEFKSWKSTTTDMNEFTEQ